MTPSPQGDLCVAKLFPPRRETNSKGSASDPGHGSSNSPRVVRCEASRNLKWSITNTGVISPIYKLSLPSPDSADLPLFQISKPNPNAAFWSMFYFAYAGHNIPPKRIEFGKIQKNPPGPNGGGTRISITGKSPEEKAVWQTLGEGNEDCVEWVVLCAALNLLEYVTIFVHGAYRLIYHPFSSSSFSDEILKAAEKNGGPIGGGGVPPPGANGGRPAPVQLRDPGPATRPGGGPPPPQNAGPPGPGGPGGPPPGQYPHPPPPQGRGGPPPGGMPMRGPPPPGGPGGPGGPPGPMGGMPMPGPGGPGGMPPPGQGRGYPPPGPGGPGGFATPPPGGPGYMSPGPGVPQGFPGGQPPPPRGPMNGPPPRRF